MVRNQAYVFRRYLWLYEMIAGQGPISFAEICERWERSSLNDERLPLPHKTFENHRIAVEEIFGVEIICDRRTNLYSLSDDGARPEPRKLLEQLLLCRRLADNPELRDAVESEPTPGGVQLLEPILECLHRRLTVRLTYAHTYNAGQPESREVVPVGLKLFKRRWYLIALLPDSHTTYSYALDRILGLEAGERHSVDRPTMRQLYADCYGIIREPGRKREHIVLRATPNQANYLAALPLHPSQREIRRDESGVWFALDLIPAYDFLMELLANGREVEVMEPASLRAEIAAEIAEMQKLYL